MKLSMNVKLNISSWILELCVNMHRHMHIKVKYACKLGRYMHCKIKFTFSCVVFACFNAQWVRACTYTHDSNCDELPLEKLTDKHVYNTKFAELYNCWSWVHIFMRCACMLARTPLKIILLNSSRKIDI